MEKHELTEKVRFGMVPDPSAGQDIEMVEAQYRTHTFARHVHETYTIGLVETGAQRFYRTGAQHIAARDGIILVNADDVHTGEAETEGGWAYRAIYPLPDHFERVCNGLLCGDRGAPYFPDAVVEDAQIAAQLRLFYELLDSPSNRLLLDTVLYAILSGLVLRHSRTRKPLRPRRPDKPVLQRVRSYLMDHLEQNLTLDELSTVAQLSPYHLVRQFKAEFGLPPHAFQVQARVIRAKALLKDGLSPATVAVACGFHDQSHLTHNFKRCMGTTPARYQKALSKTVQAG
ncbi:AraC family transcriptional regulator [Marinobacter sp. NFXS9]|uniref:AraC family transcriptional regulator n=1 Tax=Marinobacter sp. NFXS9 TaxID=2818433 RepID=UPI0032DFA358